VRLAVGAIVCLAAFSLLLGAAGFGVPDADILLQLRVPRTGLALLVGAGLGLSGAVLQGVLRNPLADPGFLGIGGCAALGAVGAFYWGLTAAYPLVLPLSGFAGAAVGCGALLLVFARAQSGPGLILAGVGVSALAAAALSLLLSAAPNPFALYEITFWLMGGLQDRTLTHLVLAAVPIALGCALLLRLGPGLDGLSLGEEAAASLGVPVARTLRQAVLGVALAVGAGAAVAGGIGFVGLVVPHLLRPFFGQRPGGLLWPSMLGGAALLLAADICARAAPLLLPLAAEPRLGVLTALLGAPFLVAAARKAAP
jgi:iron complex transport system permease protein